MSAALASRLTKLERRSSGRTLASLSDAELSALIVDLADALTAEDGAMTMRAGAQDDGSGVSEDASAVEAWRARQAIARPEG